MTLPESTDACRPVTQYVGVPPSPVGWCRTHDALILESVQLGCIGLLATRPRRRDPNTLYDYDYAPEEQLPRRFVARLRSVEGQRFPRVRFQLNGAEVGDVLDDNAPVPDGYRYHDVFHLSLLVVLGWSPVLRGLLGRKRKKNGDVDRIEDGARAAQIEEATVTAIWWGVMQEMRVDGSSLIDSSVIERIRFMTRGLEVSTATVQEWRHAILVGTHAWLHAHLHNGGEFQGDIEARTLLPRPPSTAESARVA